MASLVAPTRVLIDIDELAARLSIAKGTLCNWVYLKRIPYIKAGRCLRFDYDAAGPSCWEMVRYENGEVRERLNRAVSKTVFAIRASARK